MEKTKLNGGAHTMMCHRENGRSKERHLTFFQQIFINSSTTPRDAPVRLATCEVWLSHRRRLARRRE